MNAIIVRQNHKPSPGRIGLPFAQGNPDDLSSRNCPSSVFCLKCELILVDLKQCPLQNCTICLIKNCANDELLPTAEQQTNQK
ncbi:hypothetical protein [Gimesia fumaroli]|uniref:hypothetical protein n=1 Tax=Gimesia fumaroli TaxID=2527976 RepID=UPI0018D64829|nr:hypothetical protein [Gimesia fumaroli]